MFLSGDIFKRVTFCKALNEIFTCDWRAWEWNIDLQQYPWPPKSNSISGSQVPLKIWVLQVLIFQGFDPPARSCTLSALPGCSCSWAQPWGVNRRQIIPGERGNSNQLLFTLPVSWEEKTSTQTGVEQVMKECICIGAFRLPSDTVIIKTTVLAIPQNYSLKVWMHLSFWFSGNGFKTFHKQ